MKSISIALYPRKITLPDEACIKEQRSKLNFVELILRRILEREFLPEEERRSSFMPLGC